MTTKPSLDVDGLPTEAAGTPIITEVAIADIVTRADWQVRAKVDPAIVRSYAAVMRSGGSFPPIALARINGALYLVDGWHRLGAAQLNGAAGIWAEVTDMTADEAQWTAAQANLTHGLPLKPKEVRAVFRAYVKSRQHRSGRGYKSYRDIAADLAHRVGHTTIRNWMERDFPSVFRAMGGADPHTDTGEVRDAPAITPLARAKASLDQAAAEAPALSKEERRDLLEHWREVGQRIANGQPWEPLVFEEDENPDF